jgi:hypothetical protein
MWAFENKDFMQPSGNKEIYEALQSYLHWRFDLPAKWQFIACGVCEKSWQEAIGEKPTRFFGNEPKK